MEKKAVIFDFDFTLGDSAEGIVKCVNYGLEQTGHGEAAKEKIKRTIGMSLKDTYQYLTGSTAEKEAEKFAVCFKELADDIMVEHTFMYEEALTLLKSLKAEGFLTGIVTTKYHHRITGILKKFAMEDYIDCIIGADDVKLEKPNPEGLLAIIEKLGLKKEEVFYVGDSLIDIKTAENAKVDFVGVTTGTTSEEEFAAFPHCVILSNLKQLESGMAGKQVSNLKS